MRVIVGKKAGFCMGVRRAVDMVLEAPNKYPGPIYTFGPIIHNPQILALLEEKGITVLNEIPAQGSGTVLIRAHGVPPDTKQSLSRAGFHIIDATCPRVAKVQQIIQRHVGEDAAAIILGDPEHPEVVGLRGFAGSQGYVVSSFPELTQLPCFDNAVVVQQTTQSTSLYQHCRDWLEDNCPHYKIYSTLCDSTTLRQTEVKDLAQQVDAMIVVGGHHSGNTQRLAEISRQRGLPTYHVETDHELPGSFPDQTETVAVTAGASTPNWVIKNVQSKLERFPSDRRYLLNETSLKIQRFLLLSNLWVALGASSLCYGCATLLETPGKLLSALIVFLYVHAMHTLNNLTGDRTDKYTEPERNEFYTSHRIVLWGSAAITGTGSIAASFLLSWSAFMLIAVLSLLGLLYNFRVLPWNLSSRRFLKIREIPGSKTTVTTLAWSIVVVLVPVLSQGYNINRAIIFIFLLAICLILVRTAFFDILDMQGDRILGRETIPLLFGKKYTIQLLKGVLIAVSVGLTFASILSFSLLLAAITLCPISLYAILSSYEHSKMSSQIWIEFLVESHFIYIGLVALAIF